MKVMTTMYTLRRGGAYDRFIMMLEAFLERNCETHCLSLTSIPIRNPLFNNHVVHFPFDLNNPIINKLFVLLMFPFYLVLIGRREKIDLFIAFNSFYAFLQAVPKRILRKPMVTLIRGDFTFGLKMQNSFKYFLWLNKVIEYFGLNASDKILAVNEAIRENITRVIGNRRNVDVEILFNNILVSRNFPPVESMTIRNRYSITKDAKILVTAGVLNRGKNIELLLRAVSKIQIENLLFFIIGEGSTKTDARYVEHLKEMTKELGLEKKVIFTGWLQKEELWKMLRAADLFVLSSMNEGMPNVMLEAVGLDLPCFGSKVPGIASILQYDELMFDPLDVEALVDKVSRFFSDPQYSNYIIKLCLGRKKAFLFDWKEKAFQMVTEGMLCKGESCR
ncbi:MAG: glycosyltransferase [Candidatus Helarchaeota archaeon]|nr:glycosyltransferase [Candidatus Helarchaeota archaeon]